MCVAHGSQHRLAVSVRGYSCAEEGRPAIHLISRRLLEDSSAPESLPLSSSALPAPGDRSFCSHSPLLPRIVSSVIACGCTLHTPSPSLTRNCILHIFLPLPLVHCFPSTCAQPLRLRLSQLDAPHPCTLRESDVKELGSTPHHPPSQCPSLQIIPMR